MALLRRRDAVDEHRGSLGLDFSQWAQLTIAGGGGSFHIPPSAAALERVFSESPIVAAAVAARAAVFAEVRFAFQRVRNGRGADLFTSQALQTIQAPAPGMTTGDLLTRWEHHVSLFGNAYAFVWRGRVVVPNPMSVEIVGVELRADEESPPFAREVVGYLVRDPETRGVALEVPADNMAHFIEHPDPTRFGGMSWIRTAIAEHDADKLITEHKRRFFTNAATPNMILKSERELTDEQVARLRSMVDSRFSGVHNAHRTMVLEGGMDAQVVGASILDGNRFQALQDSGENRIAVASRVPAPVLGIALGSSPTYNNYATSLRAFVDLWARPAWRRAAEALESIVVTPADARLWYDERDVAALRTDEKAVAEIKAQDAATIRQLVDGGYQPESVAAFVASGDPNDLVHTGQLSVQLQPPGSANPAPQSDDGGDV
jgi:HK97 family phage portal protein